MMRFLFNLALVISDILEKNNVEFLPVLEKLHKFTAVDFATNLAATGEENHVLVLEVNS
jgi:hypothetical protein